MLSDVALPFTTGHHPHPFINGTSNHFKKLILPVLGSFYIFYARAIATIDLIKKPQLGDEMNTRALHVHYTSRVYKGACSSASCAQFNHALVMVGAPCDNLLLSSLGLCIL